MQRLKLLIKTNGDFCCERRLERVLRNRLDKFMKLFYGNIFGSNYFHFQGLFTLSSKVI